MAEKKYRHLQLWQRYKIEALLRAGHKAPFIADQLNVDKSTEVKELSDKIYDDYGEVIRSIEYIYTDIDGQDYGGKYHYLAGTMKKFDFDTDYFEDHNDYLEDGLKEPNIENYFFTDGSKYESKIQISLSGDTDKLYKILNYVQDTSKWQDSLLFDFEYIVNEKENLFTVTYFSFDSDSQTLSHKIFDYSRDSINEVSHLFLSRLDFGKKMVFQDNSVKIFELKNDYFDDLSEYEDELHLANSAEEIGKLKAPDIDSYFIEIREVQLDET